MRCPKCGYNSFDHNLNCPKCRKDLTAIRRILNLNIPAPGHVNFFQISNERSVFSEPILGGVEAPFGSAPMGMAGQPQGFESSYLPTAAAAVPIMAGLDEIIPTAEDDIDDIIPVDSSDDIDDIAPIDFSAQAVQEQAPPPNLADYITPAPAQPAAAMMASATPMGDDEEIEIEIDADDSQPPPASNTFMASPAPVGQQPQVSPAASHQAQAAMDQIKSALAQTGDLGYTAQPAPEVYTPNIQVEGLADAESSEIEFPVGDFGAAPPDDQAAAEYDFPVGDFGPAPQDEQGAVEYDFPVGDFGPAPQDVQPAVEEFDFPVGDFGAAPQEDQPTVDFDFPVGDFGPAPQDDQTPTGFDFPVGDFEAAPAEAQPVVDDFDFPVGDFGAAPSEEQPMVEEFDFPVGDFGGVPQDGLETDLGVEPEADLGGGTLVAPVAVPEIPVESFDEQLADATFSVPKKTPSSEDDDLSSMVGDLDLDDLDNDL